MNTTPRIRTRIEVEPPHRTPGYLALVWVTEPPRAARRIWQIFTGQIQNVVYRAAQEYATAVVYWAARVKLATWLFHAACLMAGMKFEEEE